MLPERQHVEVVALVALAGGSTPSQRCHGDLEPELPVPVLMQEHLGGQASVLPTVLQRRMGQTVIWAEDGPALEGGRVVVCPPRSQVESCPTGRSRSPSWLRGATARTTRC